MKKNLSLLFALAVFTHLPAQRVILDTSLKNVLGSGVEGDVTSTSAPDSLKNWTFSQCSTANESGTAYLQIGSDGSLTTCSLAGLTGNAVISVTVKALVDDFKLSIDVVGNGDLDKSTGSGYANAKWGRDVPFLLTNADSETKLKFRGTGKFRIANIVVKDIDDGVFYESFSKCNGSGGNDGYFNSDKIKSLAQNYLDNPYDLKYYSLASSANLCLYIAENGFFTIPSYLPSETGAYVLSFRVAGDNRYTGPCRVTVNDKNNNTHRYNIDDVLKGEWIQKDILLTDFDLNQTIIIGGKGVFLDDVLLSEVKNISLSESADNGALLSSKSGKTVFANLTRTFKANIWNTCCLPFTLTPAMVREAAGDDELNVELRCISDITDGVFNFSKTDAVSAGVPFIMKVDKDIVNPLFDNVVITAPEPHAVQNGGYSFVGIYSRTALLTDGTNIFLGTDGKLHTPTSNNNMNGMRAYMVIPNNALARVTFIDDEQVTNLPDVESHVPRNTSASFFTLQGQKVLKPAKGVYIRGGKKIIIK